MARTHATNTVLGHYPAPRVERRAGYTSPMTDRSDRRFLQRAAELALAAEAEGNLPIGALLVLDGAVVAAAGNRSLRPLAHPGRHAEVRALAALPEALVPRLGEITCYTTLEPCLMCFGALVLHRVGRVVFGADDPLGGATGVVPWLPDYVRAKAAAIEWIGPALPEVCDPLARRALAAFTGAQGG